jgi:DNA-binding MarR family transcriptional regulator
MSVSLRTAPNDLDELPPSCKLVYMVMRARDNVTQTELADATRLPSRTVRYALDRLEEHDLVTARPSVRDGRQKRYTTRNPESEG